MIIKKLTFPLLVSISLFLSACGSSQLYDGATLPSEEVAFIKVFGKEFQAFGPKEFSRRPSLIILKGNNKTYSWNSEDLKSILPGNYEIFVDMGYFRGEIRSIVSNNTTINTEKKLPGGISCTIAFEAKKGKTYIVKFLNNIDFPIRSGKGIYLLEKYAYGTGKKTVLYGYDFYLTINEYITGSQIEDGNQVGSCSDETND